MVQPSNDVTGAVRPKKKMVTRMKAVSPCRFDPNRSKRELASHGARALRVNREHTNGGTTTAQSSHSPVRQQHRDNRAPTGLMARAQNNTQRLNTCDDDSFTYDDNTTARDDDSLSSDDDYSSTSEDSDYASRSDLGDSFSLSMASTASQSFEKDETQRQEEPEVAPKDGAGSSSSQVQVKISESKSDTDPMDELSRGMPSVVWEEQDDDESEIGGSHSSAEALPTNYSDKYAPAPIIEEEELDDHSRNEEISSMCSPRPEHTSTSAPHSMSSIKHDWGLEDDGARAIPYQKFREDERPLLAVMSTGSNSNDEEIEVFHESNEYDEDEEQELQEALEFARLSRQCEAMALEETMCSQAAFPQRTEAEEEAETAQEQRGADPEQDASPQSNKHPSVEAMMPFDEVRTQAKDESQSMWQPPMFPDSPLPPIHSSPTTETARTSCTNFYEAQEQEPDEKHAEQEPAPKSFSFYEPEPEEEPAPTVTATGPKTPPRLMFCSSPHRRTPPVSPLQRKKHVSPAPTASPAPRKNDSSPRKNGSTSVSPSKRTTQALVEKIINVEPAQPSTNMFDFVEPKAVIKPAVIKPAISPIRKGRKSQRSTPERAVSDDQSHHTAATVGVDMPSTQQPGTALHDVTALHVVTSTRLQKVPPSKPQSPPTPSSVSTKDLAENDAEQTRPPIIGTDEEVETAPTITSPRHDHQDLMIKGSTSEDEVHLREETYPQYIIDKMKTPPEQLKGLINVAMTEGNNARRMNACGAFKQLSGVNKRNALSLAWTEGVLVAHATVLMDQFASDQELNRTLLSMMSMVHVPLNRRIIFMSPKMMAGLTKCIKDENPQTFIKAAHCVELLAKDKRNRPLMANQTKLMQALCDRLDQYIDLDKTENQTVETLVELGLNDASKSFDKEKAASFESVALSALTTILYLSTGVQISYDLARIDVLVKVLIKMSDRVQSKFASLCNAIFSNLTQHPDNVDHLVFKVPTFVTTLVISAGCDNPERRKYACFALQNLSKAKSCRSLLGSVPDLIPKLAEDCLRPDNFEEQLAALTALCNLTKNQANLLHFTNNQCMAALISWSRDNNQAKLQYLASDALVTLSYWMRQCTLYALR